MNVREGEALQPGIAEALSATAFSGIRGSAGCSRSTPSIG